MMRATAVSGIDFSPTTSIALLSSTGSSVTPWPWTVRSMSSTVRSASSA
jgi:hypothetical protein